MDKIWTIARREFGAMVATKAFLLSIALMPLLMFGGILVAAFLERAPGVVEKRIAVIDGTGGELFEELQAAATARNAPSSSTPTMSTYILERFSSDEATDVARLALSDRVRENEIAAFVEIPATLLDDASGQGEPPAVRYYAPNAMLSEERQWLQQVLTEKVTARRLAVLQVDPAAVRRAMAPVAVSPRGLFKEGDTSGSRQADDESGLTSMFVPMGFMMLLFAVVFISAQPMLEGVMEEKSGRIAEVLLGSVNPFQLMFGKLLGIVAGSLSAVAIYAAGGFIAASYWDWTDMIPMKLLPLFLIFQVLAVMMFGSLFLAIGAAVTQMKDAQSLLLPVWLLLALPLFSWLQIVREPNGPVAVWMSFFPPATPLVMVLRLATEAVIPPWQVILSITLLVVATLACVFLAGRVFRIGILWQGKSPRFIELARWALRG